MDKIRAKFDYNCNCTNAWGQFTVSQNNNNARANNRSAQEEDTALYLQADYQTQLGSMPVRGNLGLRYVGTSQTVQGYFSRGAVLEKITDDMEKKEIAKIHKESERVYEGFEAKFYKKLQDY